MTACPTLPSNLPVGARVPSLLGRLRLSEEEATDCYLHRLDHALYFSYNDGLCLQAQVQVTFQFHFSFFGLFSGTITNASVKKTFSSRN